MPKVPWDGGARGVEVKSFQVNNYPKIMSVFRNKTGKRCSKIIQKIFKVSISK